MITAAKTVSVGHEPELLGQTVVVIGASAGIGLETARRARREGAEVVLAGRNPERLARAAHDVGARSSPPSTRTTRWRSGTSSARCPTRSTT
jgi:NAD(P)-dependent dehydrogenase (short-subunit alcohol dehydrogenase family)